MKVHIPKVGPGVDEVTHVPVFVTPPGVLVTVKYTVTPPIRLLLWSLTVAVTVWLVLTGSIAAAGVRVTVVGIDCTTPPCAHWPAGTSKALRTQS